ncbi:unnamed protein product, partial [Didymodactylos carnosus]
FNVPQHLNIVRFIKYVENWITGAIFSPDIWNLFDFIGLRPRINNPIEGYHNKQNRYVTANPNILHWINSIQKEETNAATRLLQEIQDFSSTKPMGCSREELKMN